MAGGLTSMLLKPLLSSGAIGAFDALSTKLLKAPSVAGSALGKVLKSWKKLDHNQKEQVVSIVIATTAAAVAAVTAATSKGRRKRVARKARKFVKRVRKLV